MPSLFPASHLVNLDNGHDCGCPGCAADSIESPPESWPEWTDQDFWAPGPELDGLEAPEEFPSLDAWVDAQAEAYDALGNDSARLVAEELRSLGFRIRLTSAQTPDEFRARTDRLDDDARETWRAEGYLAGVAAGRARKLLTITGTQFGHDA